MSKPVTRIVYEVEPTPSKQTKGVPKRIHRPLPYGWAGDVLAPALLAVITVSLFLRVAAALYHGNAVLPLPGIHDQISYDTLGRQLLNGRGFTFPTNWWPATSAGEPTAHWSYLYTTFLAVVYSITGGVPVAARLIQAVIAGLFQPWLVWRIGGRLFGPAVGLVAAALSAVYAYFVYYAGALMTETYYILAILWLLDIATLYFCIPATMIQCAYGWPSSRRWVGLMPWVLLGLAVGTAALLRQVALLFLPVLVFWLFWSQWRARQLLAQREKGVAGRQRNGGLLQGTLGVAVGFMVTLIVISLMILPWTARNYRAFNEFVLLNTNAGYAFFWANHPIHGTRFIPILPTRTYLEMIPSELHGLDEPVMERELMQRGMNFVLQNPRRYLLLSLSRSVEYFKFWPSSDSSLLSNLARVASFGLLLPFMLYGLVIAIVRRRSVINRWQESSVLLLYLFMLTYTLIHLLSWALIRYRLPVDAVLMIFAAVGIVDLLQRGVSAVIRRTVFVSPR